MTEQTNPLNPEQGARAEALTLAARLLGTTTPGLGGMGRPVLPEYRSIQDLYDLAEYVLTGRDPMTDYLTTLEDVPGQAEHIDTLLHGAPHLRRVEDTPLPDPADDPTD